VPPGLAKTLPQKKLLLQELNEGFQKVHKISFFDLYLRIAALQTIYWPSIIKAIEWKESDFKKLRQSLILRGYNPFKYNIFGKGELRLNGLVNGPPVFTKEEMSELYNHQKNGTVAKQR
jgi:hypothetical protein